jgi:hypothetical protein
MVWGELRSDGSGTLNLFLATQTGDRSFPFAELSGFQAVVDPAQGGTGTGTGTGFLDRFAQLPPGINWQKNP